MLFIPFVCKASDTNELRQELEAQINQLQQQINQYQGNIGENKQKAKSLESEINILESQISSIRLEIKQIDLVIQESTLNIQDMEEKINIVEGQIIIKKDILAEYIRLVEEYDKDNLLEIVLKNDSLADFFDEINALESAQQGLQETLYNIRALKTDLTERKDEQESERAQQYQLRSLQEVQRNNVSYQQNRKEGLLKETRGEEEMYQSLIQDAESNIGHIKEQLSLLDKYNITLDEAVQNAIFAASKTGIRPAFLLGVLEAESRLGLNVGTGNWKEDMYQCYRELGYITKSGKEKDAFFQICQELGLNPDLQPVSAEPWYGCGGAMGVAQFMPTTWMAYRERVVSLTGHNPPNPWNHLDAFTAAAIKLSDGGANQRTETGERMAYGKYLGGSNYKKWMYHKVTNYVIQLADNFQEEYFN
ncbi:MAG: lytic murein transglycosylase [bacterium]